MTHEEYLAACLQREVAARESHGGEGRIRTAMFPARKSLEDFDFDHARGLKREAIAHLGTLDFVTAKQNVVFLNAPGTGKTTTTITSVVPWGRLRTRGRDGHRPPQAPLRRGPVRHASRLGMGAVMPIPGARADVGAVLICHEMRMPLVAESASEGSTTGR